MIPIQDDITALQDDFEHRYPQDVLRWATDTFGTKIAVVTSFQPTGIVTLHMLSEIAPRTPVVTLETGLLFPETVALMDELERRFNLDLHRVRPAQTVDEQNRRHGDALWQRNPDKCCHLRKVIPLRQALQGYSAWFTGLRRDQSPRRANTQIIDVDTRYDKIRIAPLATWTERMIWDYIDAYDLPYNTLHDQNYASIGCEPCTQPSTGDDPRSGRWVNSGKIECGIHTSETHINLDIEGQKA